ncbi:hypothetical protein [Falsibacillus pallidus]|uniref:Uncharacterized protein n=1 Tax=Falsibacillus pallidus TaxID=493781 RepID=A0A370GMD9_9BACI|nr:hypothetical protein [Falsibacillus pallidus]RDI43063.1 hypothetical protein DFR59_104114 [Falsibacillus pallidus]
MFDPTAYENLKVVLEGALYDLDLSGEIKVIGRKDSIDLASLSRLYEVTASLSSKECRITASIRIEAGLQQLASELLALTDSSPGVVAEIEFKGDQVDLTDRNINLIKEMWGTDREFEEKNIISSLNPPARSLLLTFNRIITEEMVDDLLEMTHHTVKTLTALSR